MANQNSELRNPLFWCLIAFLLGVGLGVWGWIKEDCQGGAGCWHGSGFLKWAGGILIVVALFGWYKLSWGKDKR